MTEVVENRSTYITRTRQNTVLAAFLFDFLESFNETL
jgi:hypothetical protein